MKFLVSFCIFLSIFTTLRNKVVECNENPYVRTMRERVQRIADEVKKNGEIKGRKDDLDPYSRPKLPVDWLNEAYSNITCGSTNLVASSGYFTFEIKSEKDKPCKLDFIGSKKYKCKVAIYCHGTLRLKPPSENGTKCVDEYLEIYDGTVGVMRGCDPFSFRSKARIPRNEGRDLYITIKGHSPNSKCVMFCTEDWTDAHKETIETFKILSLKKPYENFTNQGKCQCGKRMDNLGGIEGGEETKKFEFPWMGALVLSNQIVNRYPWCSVVLISDRHALTAAHCFDHDVVHRYPFEVVFHSHLLNKRHNYYVDEEEVQKYVPGWDLPEETDQSEGTVRREVKSFLIHPLYHTGEKLNFDIALITLRTPIHIAFDNKVSPICLPTIKEYREYKENEDMMIISGWGKAKWESEINSRLPRKQNQTYLSHNGLLGSEPKFTLFSAANWDESGNGPCNGDSGSPLVYKIDESKNQYVLAGVMSANIMCSGAHVPNLYTDVQEFVQWVYYHTIDDKTEWCGR